MLATIDMDIDPAHARSELSVGQQQMIEIAKALVRAVQGHHHGRADSVASVITKPAFCWAIVKRLREKNIAVVYISHRLEEIFELADRVTVLRDGRTVGTAPHCRDDPRDTCAH